jgi:hypothetical protein
MPATSVSQQRLMAQAYAIKTGKMKPSDLNPEYKDQIVDLANNMTEKDLKDYAETSHKGLPKKVEESHIPSFEFFINESKWSNIMKGVKSGNPNGPWSIVIIDKMSKKVIHQDKVDVRDAIPAHYEELKKKYPNAHISIEDKQGTQVFKESAEDLKENAPTATVGSVNGMGAPTFPGNPTSQDSFVDQAPGSGDIPFQLTKGKPRKKKKSSFSKFNDFVKGSQELRSAF